MLDNVQWKCNLWVATSEVESTLKEEEEELKEL